MAHPEPPGYRLKEPLPKPKIGPYLERIAQIIEEDKALPKKQRHTAKRIYERLREMGYGGKYAQVKEAVRGFRNRLTPQTLLKTKNNRKDLTFTLFII